MASQVALGFLCLFSFVSVNGLSDGQPTFEWVEGGYAGHEAALKITYPNGVIDVARLNPYNPFPTMERSDFCIFDGYLQDETDVHVTLSGCPGNKDFQVMFRSRHLEDFMFKVDANQVEAVKPLIGSASPNRNGFAFKDIVIPSGDRKEDSTRDLSRQLNPKGYIMRTKIRYDDNFKKEFDGKIESTIASVMSFAQAQFKLPSLKTVIQLNNSPPEHFPGAYPASSPNLDLLAQSSTDPNFDAFIYLTCTKVNLTTQGVAFISSTCGGPQNRTSLNEWVDSDLNTGVTVAHEVAHNLGVGHDFGPNGEDDVRKDSKGNSCTKVGGIMDYTPPFNKWTTCSVEDLTSYINWAQPFCLKTIE